MTTYAKNALGLEINRIDYVKKISETIIQLGGKTAQDNASIVYILNTPVGEIRMRVWRGANSHAVGVDGTFINHELAKQYVLQSMFDENHIKITDYGAFKIYFERGSIEHAIYQTTCFLHYLCTIKIVVVHDYKVVPLYMESQCSDHNRRVGEITLTDENVITMKNVYKTLSELGVDYHISYKENIAYKPIDKGWELGDFTVIFTPKEFLIVGYHKITKSADFCARPNESILQ